MKTTWPSAPPPKRKAPILVVFLFAFILLVLYPNPYLLGVSISRIFQPRVNPEVVAHLLDEAPQDPAALEAYVLRKIPYQYDWVTYGVPFYFPRAEGVLSQGTGDCKSRFVILASLFETLDIPYRQSFSLSHFWIIYEGKEETAYEQEANSFLLRDEDGTRLQVPREDARQIFDTLREGFWDVMPTHKKALLLASLPITMLLGWLMEKTRPPLPH